MSGRRQVADRIANSAVGDHAERHLTFIRPVGGGGEVEVALIPQADDEHPLTGMDPVTEDQEQNEELAQALEDSVQVGIVASANISKGGKSLE